MYDDDSAAWAFYERMYREVRDMASQEIDPALLTARNRPVDIQDAPLLTDDSPSMLIVGDGSAGETDEERTSIARKAKEIRNRIGPVLPAARGNRLTLEADRKASIRSALRQRPPADAEPASFTILTDTRTATFTGKDFALDHDPAIAAADGAAMTEHFASFEQFSGTPQEIFELQQPPGDPAARPPRSRRHGQGRTTSDPNWIPSCIVKGLRRPELSAWGAPRHSHLVAGIRTRTLDP